MPFHAILLQPKVATEPVTVLHETEINLTLLLVHFYSPFCICVAVNKGLILEERCRRFGRIRRYYLQMYIYHSIEN